MLKNISLSEQVKSTSLTKVGHIVSSFPESTESAHTIFFEQTTLLITISMICTVTIIGFLYKILSSYNKKQKYQTLTQTHIQLLDNSNNGEDIQNNLNQYFNMVKMQFAKKIRGNANLLYKNISNITLEDIKLYLNKFDEDILPSFLFGLIIISLVMGMIFIVFDSRIIEDINYPNLVGALILLL